MLTHVSGSVVVSGHVFLCYAREDADRVDELEAVLRGAGVRVWRDTADLWPGQDWRVHVRRAITEEAVVFLACFSSRGLARRARFQNEELVWAVDQVRRRSAGDPWLIPVRFDDCLLPNLDLGAGRTLAGIQRADLFGEQAAAATDRLVTAVFQILGMASAEGRMTVRARSEPSLSAIRAIPFVPIPAQLPSTPPDFVNRTAELTQLAAAFARSRPDGRIFAISGSAGSGKSALAVRFAYEALADFPDGQLYVDLRAEDATPVDPADVLDRFLRALGVPDDQLPPAVDERQALYRSMLSRKRALILLDNASDEWQVRRLLPGGQDCLILATSRSVLDGLDLAQLVLLEPLSVGHSLELLERLAGSERITAEPEAARQVARYCDYLPLALRIAGARLRSRPRWRISDLADRLGDEHQRLSELRAGDRSVRVSFALSYSVLAPAPARAFCLLGQAPGLDFGRPAAAAALGCDIRAAETTLEMLVDLALVESQVAGRYRLHDLLRVFAREQSVSIDENERHSSRDRVLALYRDSATGWLSRARGEYQPDDDALAWFDADGDNAMDAAEVAYAIGAWGILNGIIDPLRHLMTLRGRTTAQERLLSLAASAADLSGDPKAQVHYSILLAEHWMGTGRVAQTPPLYERALAAAGHVTKEPAVRLWALTHYGDALRLLGEPSAASLRYGEAFAIAALGRDMARQAWVLVHWGGAQRDLGRLDVAVAMLSRALEVGRARSDPGNVAWVLTHLAAVLQDQSRFGDTDAALSQALTTMRDNDDLVGQEFVLNNTAELLRRRNEPTAAADAYWQASQIAELRGDTHAASRWTELARNTATEGGQ
jgi:tetratricopeptide (TPR) repeat protein